MQKKRLIVHVGANKTASSAIQKFLSLNSEELRGLGLIVPSQKFEIAPQVSGYHVFGFEELLRHPEEGRERLEQSLKRIAHSQPEPTTIVLSGENLAAHPQAPQLFAGLVDDFDVEVILYIRRQDEFLLSYWQQWNSKAQTDFWAWVTSVVGMLGNWRTYIENWEKAVPRECIKVRLFERSRMVGGDAIQDFCEILAPGLPFEQFLYPSGVINPSFSDAVMDLVKGNDLVFRDAHDNDFYKFVEEMTGTRHIKRGRHSSISFDERSAIIQRYSVCNSWVKQHYFPEVEGDLFTPPLESDYHYPSQQQIDQEKFEFLATIVYRMYQNGEKE